MFTLTVAAAPEVIPPVIEEPTKSSGGALGLGWMMLLMMACIRQRKKSYNRT